jgi:hypothetical protein
MISVTDSGKKKYHKIFISFERFWGVIGSVISWNSCFERCAEELGKDIIIKFDVLYYGSCTMAVLVLSHWLAPPAIRSGKRFPSGSALYLLIQVCESFGFDRGSQPNLNLTHVLCIHAGASLALHSRNTLTSYLWYNNRLTVLRSLRYLVLPSSSSCGVFEVTFISPVFIKNSFPQELPPTIRLS